LYCSVIVLKKLDDDLGKLLFGEMFSLHCV
jgi:hypothetical protein